ncbi:16S rRNA (guanine(966)-N(2))-methyltransferase RsmD [Oceanobacillus kapialis]|uniref:16S rRNA (Guanine(966)-N(2))-methyltransferase RsmD n=1 Tax=Oceanobacillus kapialis TaxID=481353 RepID=A0ABW5PYM9_9BACI
MKKLRVIAGIHKGRQLKAVPGKSTRPTTDKVKEAIFQRMGPFFDGGTFLDLFSGSGSLGIEALSRGMEFGIFVDKHPKAVQIINENLRLLKLENNAEVYRAEATRALQATAKRNLKFDLLLLDPPYGKVDYGKILRECVELDILNQSAIIYCEHEPAEDIAYDPRDFTLLKEENYGGAISITILQKN